MGWVSCLFISWLVSCLRLVGRLDGWLVCSLNPITFESDAELTHIGIILLVAVLVSQIIGWMVGGLVWLTVYWLVGFISWFDGCFVFIHHNAKTYHSISGWFSKGDVF